MEPISTTSNSSRRNWSAAEKARIVREHLRDGKSVADLAEAGGTSPSQVHSWIKLVLERADVALADRRDKTDHQAEKVIAVKDQRIRHLEEVTAELSMELLQLKKTRGAI